jgi:hypothetical protein
VGTYGSGAGGVSRRVVERELKARHALETLACGHVVWSFELAEPKTRRCLECAGIDPRSRPWERSDTR